MTLPPLPVPATVSSMDQADLSRGLRYLRGVLSMYRRAARSRLYDVRRHWLGRFNRLAPRYRAARAGDPDACAFVASLGASFRQ